MKKFLAVMLAALMILSFASCSKDSGDEKSTLSKENEIVNNYVQNEQGDIFYFEMIDTETVELTGFKGPDTPHAVAIPETLDGKSVVSIDAQAFYYSSCINALTIPASVTSIGKYAFAGCAALTALTIPSTVVSIGEGAFSKCSALASVTVESGSLATIPYVCFIDCSSLTALTIPATVTTIDRAAFSGCTALETVVIPEGTAVIGVQAFHGCEKLASLTLPASVTSIGTSAFDGCSSLYRSGVTCPAGSASETYINALNLEASAPAEE